MPTEPYSGQRKADEEESRFAETGLWSSCGLMATSASVTGYSFDGYDGTDESFEKLQESPWPTAYRYPADAGDHGGVEVNP